MTKVFLLWHCRPLAGAVDDNDTDNKLIGVYSSAAQADAARSRKLKLEGFRDFPDCFLIDEYEVDKEKWSEGFIWQEN